VLVGRGEREHLYCEDCGAVRTLAPEQLDPLRDKVRELFGYEVRFTHFPIVGLCPRCVGRDQSSEHPAPAEHEHSHGDHVHSHPHAH
jgi:Fur family ferric uptake transcriptional regulator